MNYRSLHFTLLVVLALLLAACAEQASEEPLEPEHESEAPGVDEEPVVEEPASGADDPLNPIPESEVQEVAVGESFEAQGLTWTVTEAYVADDVPNSEGYERVADPPPGPFLMVSVLVENASDEYLSPNFSWVRAYTSYTSRTPETFSTVVPDELDISGEDLAPDTSREGMLVFPFEEADEEIRHLEFSNDLNWNEGLTARVVVDEEPLAEERQGGIEPQEVESPNGLSQEDAEELAVFDCQMRKLEADVGEEEASEWFSEVSQQVIDGNYPYDDFGEHLDDMGYSC